MTLYGDLSVYHAGILHGDLKRPMASDNPLANFYVVY